MRCVPAGGAGRSSCPEDDAAEHQDQRRVMLMDRRWTGRRLAGIGAKPGRVGDDEAILRRVPLPSSVPVAV